MTEDMLQEHAAILTQLGTTEEGARIRAQMQSASLLSDMEAFKVKATVNNQNKSVFMLHKFSRYYKLPTQVD